MKINELITENHQLDELGAGWATAKKGLGQMAKGVGNVAAGAAQGAPGTVGNVVKGVGAVAGGLRGAWDQAKAGYQSARKAVGGDATADATNNPNAKQSNTTTSNQQQTTNNPAANIAPNQQTAATAAPKMNINQLMAMVDTLNPKTKQALVKRLAPQTPAQTVTGIQPNVAAPNAPVATPLANVAESKNNVLDFHSKFLGRAI